MPINQQHPGKYDIDCIYLAVYVLSTTVAIHDMYSLL